MAPDWGCILCRTEDKGESTCSQSGDVGSPAGPNQALGESIPGVDLPAQFVNMVLAGQGVI